MGAFIENPWATRNAAERLAEIRSKLMSDLNTLIKQLESSSHVLRDELCRAQIKELHRIADGLSSAQARNQQNMVEKLSNRSIRGIKYLNSLNGRGNYYGK